MNHIKLFENYNDHGRQTVYHGSPYEFNEFDMMYFGEGEGASGWGYGIYFTSDLETAKWYAEKLEHEEEEGWVYEATIPNDERFYNLDLPMKAQSEYVQACFKNMSPKRKIMICRDLGYDDFVEETNDEVANGEFTELEGTVIISEWLDDQINDIGGGPGSKELLDMLKIALGTDYSTDAQDERKVSQFLINIDIDGFTYDFDGVNYVVFHDSDIELVNAMMRIEC